MTDFYQILEVPETASNSEIKDSYRRLSKQYHPDINPDGADKFKEIVEAYEVLSNPDSRSKYDMRRKSGFDSFIFNDDIIGDVFFKQNVTIPNKVIKLALSPFESYLGAKKTINYDKLSPCNDCGGNGGESSICGDCGGTGSMVKRMRTSFMEHLVKVTCTKCSGLGKIIVNPCKTCNGLGSITETNTIVVDIPENSCSGYHYKLEKYGDYLNGIYGNLLIRIEVIPMDNFERVGDNLIYNLYLNLDEAKVISELKVPHPNGELTLKMPKIFDTSKPLRLKNKGYPNGDMYIKLQVKFERSE